MPPRGSVTSFINSKKIAELREAFCFAKPLIIIYGPSGCGKRFAATQVASETNIKLLDLTETDDFVSRLSHLTFLAADVVPFVDGSSLRPSEALAISDFIQRKNKFRLILFADEESELLRVLPPHVFVSVHMRPITDLNMRKFFRAKLPHMADHQVEALVLEASGDFRVATNLVTLYATSRKRKLPEVFPGNSIGADISFFHAIGRTLYRKKETFQVNALLEMPSVIGNFMFANFLHENAVDFISDVKGVAFFSKFFAFSDLLRDDEVKLSFVLHAWQSTPSHCSPGGFREFRKPRKLQVRPVADHILRYTASDDHCMSKSEKRDRLFAANALLQATQGTFFPRVPGLFLTGIHNAANWQSEWFAPARIQQPLEDDIQDVEW